MNGGPTTNWNDVLNQFDVVAASKGYLMTDDEVLKQFPQFSEFKDPHAAIEDAFSYVRSKNTPKYQNKELELKSKFEDFFPEEKEKHEKSLKLKEDGATVKIEPPKTDDPEENLKHLAVWEFVTGLGDKAREERNMQKAPEQGGDIVPAQNPGGFLGNPGEEMPSAWTRLLPPEASEALAVNEAIFKARSEESSAKFDALMANANVDPQSQADLLTSSITGYNMYTYGKIYQLAQQKHGVDLYGKGPLELMQHKELMTDPEIRAIMEDSAKKQRVVNDWLRENRTEEWRKSANKQVNQAIAKGLSDSNNPAFKVWYNVGLPVFKTLVQGGFSAISAMERTAHNVTGGVLGSPQVAEWASEKHGRVESIAEDNGLIAAFLTEPAGNQGALFEDGKLQGQRLIPAATKTITNMVALVGLGGGTAPGIIASGYALVYEESRKEAVESGYSPAQAEEFAEATALVQGMLELVAPNKLLFNQSVKSGFRKEFMKALAGGATRSQALKRGLSLIGREIGEENVQEILQELSDKAIKTAYNHAPIDGQFDFSWFDTDETMERVVLTTIAAGGAVTPNAITSSSNKGLEATSMYAAANNYEKFKAAMERGVAKGEITEEQAARIDQNVQEYKASVDRLKGTGALNDEQVARLAHLHAQKNKTARLQEAGGMSEERAAGTQALLDERIERARNGIPEPGEVLGGDQAATVFKQNGGNEEMEPTVMTHDWEMVEADLEALLAESPELAALVEDDSFAQDPPQEDGPMQPPFVMEDGSILDGRKRLVTAIRNGEKTAGVLVPKPVEMNQEKVAKIDQAFAESQRPADEQYVLGITKRLQKAFNVPVSYNQNEFDEYAKRAFPDRNPDDFRGLRDRETNTIYLNPKRVSKDTPIHEVAHIWTDMFREKNEAAYAHGISLAQNSKWGQKLYETLKSKHSDVYSEEKLWEEVLVEAIGLSGTDVYSKIEDKAGWEKFLEEIARFFRESMGFSANDPFNVYGTTLDEFATRASEKILSGKQIGGDVPGPIGEQVVPDAQVDPRFNVGELPDKANAYRGINGPFDPGFKGMEFYAENKEYAGVFGSNIGSFEIDLRDALNLDKWNRIAEEVGIRDEITRKPHFTIHSDFVRDLDFSGGTMAKFRGRLTLKYGPEEGGKLYNELIEDIKSASVIVGRDIGNEDQLVYAVRDKAKVRRVSSQSDLLRESGGGLLAQIRQKYKSGLGQQDVDAQVLFREPVPQTKRVADDYISRKGLPPYVDRRIHRIDEQFHKRVADEFEKSTPDPYNPEVVGAYAALVEETSDQYKAMLDAGARVELYTGKGEPYATADEMLADLRDNNHMYVLPTEAAFEGATKITDLERQENILLRDSGLKDANGAPMLNNDVFRAVHDYFGHSKRGNGFGPIGEENAWDAHRQMFGHKAQRALFSETKAQNAWVNYGQHIRRPDGSIPRASDEDYVPLSQRPFASQGMRLLQDEFIFPEEYGYGYTETGAVQRPGESMADASVFRGYNTKNLTPKQKGILAKAIKFVRATNGDAPQQGDLFSAPVPPNTVRLKIRKDNTGAPEFTDSRGMGVGVKYQLVPWHFTKEMKSQYPSKDLDGWASVVADRLIADYQKNWANDPDVQEAVGWYSVTSSELKKKVGFNIYTFVQLLAVTSPQTVVDENFAHTEEILSRFATGEFDPIMERLDGFIEQLSERPVEDVITEWANRTASNKRVFDTKFSAVSNRPDMAGKSEKQITSVVANELASKRLPEQYRYLVNQFIRQKGNHIKKAGSDKLFGVESETTNIVKVLYGAWRKYQASAPKVNNFTGNLLGSVVAPTIDRWAARTIRRMIYEPKHERYRIPPVAENGVTGDANSGDYALAERAMTMAGERLGMDPRDFQAVMWFAEKKLWGTNGWADKKASALSHFKTFIQERKLARSRIGVTIFEGDAPDRFTPEKLQEAGNKVRKAIEKLPGVYAQRVSISEGLYDGGGEPSLDIEFTIPDGTDLSDLYSEVAEIAGDSNQESIMVITNGGTNGANSRKVAEVFLKEPSGDKTLGARIMGLANEAGIGGLTVAKDLNGQVIGFVAASAPEYSLYYGGNLDPTNEEIAEAFKQQEDAINKLGELIASDTKLSELVLDYQVSDFAGAIINKGQYEQIKERQFKGFRSREEAVRGYLEARRQSSSNNNAASAQVVSGPGTGRNGAAGRDGQRYGMGTSGPGRGDNTTWRGLGWPGRGSGRGESQDGIADAAVVSPEVQTFIEKLEEYGVDVPSIVSAIEQKFPVESRYEAAEIYASYKRGTGGRQRGFETNSIRQGRTSQDTGKKEVYRYVRENPNFYTPVSLEELQNQAEELIDSLGGIEAATPALTTKNPPIEDLAVMQTARMMALRHYGRQLADARKAGEDMRMRSIGTTIHEIEGILSKQATEAGRANTVLRLWKNYSMSGFIGLVDVAIREHNDRVARLKGSPIGWLGKLTGKILHPSAVEFVDPLTEDQEKELMAKYGAMANLPDGSILQHQAFINLAKSVDGIVPRSGLFDMFMSLQYAAVLSGVTTQVLNAGSSATVILSKVPQNLLNFSWWAASIKDAVKDGSIRTFWDRSPLGTMITQFEAAYKGSKHGTNAALSTMRRGSEGNKYMEIGPVNGAGFTRAPLNPLERNNGKPFIGGKWNPYNYAKYVGRALSAVDMLNFNTNYESDLYRAIYKTYYDMGMRGPGLRQTARDTYFARHADMEAVMDQLEAEVNEFNDAFDRKLRARFERKDGQLTLKNADAYVTQRLREILMDKAQDAITGSIDQMSGEELKTEYDKRYGHVHGIAFDASSFRSELKEEAMLQFQSNKQEAQRLAQGRIFTDDRFGAFGHLQAGLANMMNQSGFAKGVLRPIILFTKVPGNLVEYMLDAVPVYGLLRAHGFSPTGLIKRLGWIEKSAMMGPVGSESYYEQAGRAYLGTAAFMTLAMLAAGNDDDDFIEVSGKGANYGNNYSQKRELGESAMPPYTMRVGGFRFNYLNMPSLALPMALIGNYNDLLKDSDLSDEDKEERIMLAAIATSGSITDLSLLTGVKTLAEMIENSVSGDDRAIEAAFKAAIKTYGGFASRPLPQNFNFINQVEQIMDPTSYSQKSIKATLYYTLGIQRFTNHPNVDMFGRTQETLPGTNLMPMKQWIGMAGNDELVNFLAENGAIPTPPRLTAEFRLMSEIRELTEKERYEFATRSGKIFHELLSDWYNSNQEFVDAYGQEVMERVGKDKNMVQLVVSRLSSAARTRAKAELVEEWGLN